MRGVLILERNLSAHTNIVDISTLVEGSYCVKIIGEEYQFEEILIKN